MLELDNSKENEENIYFNHSSVHLHFMATTQLASFRGPSALLSAGVGRKARAPLL